MPSEHEPGHTIEIYVHSDGDHGPDLVEVPSDGRVADLVSEDESLWLEDANEALPADSSLPKRGSHADPTSTAAAVPRSRHRSATPAQR